MAGLGDQLSVVMKFGGSSVASAARMEEVAGLILTFPEERPVVVLSAIRPGPVSSDTWSEARKGSNYWIPPYETLDVLSTTALVPERRVGWTPPASRGAHDRSMMAQAQRAVAGRSGAAAWQKGKPRCADAEAKTMDAFHFHYDAFDIGFMTTDEFGNADILEATYPAVAKRLHGDWILDPAIPVVTGFLGKGWKSGAVTTLGRGGSDLTATTIGKALGLREIQVWKDVDGVLTCDPNIYPHAKTVPYLTFEEATELAYFGAQVNMSLIVHDSEAKALVEALHQAFFQDDVLAQVEAENLVVG
ncbi:unnamed protein product [Miscanthus lutarioriparius]|uniref:Aspartate/glutamate/uridylate kinase domain-containing protein n=1 Tax=Miscanthus lutarioriparius TaxID=422564 RepID=A0A811P5H2_9POAL|nr:unnamed protein product [Miscanthus lutarioriparius]